MKDAVLNPPRSRESMYVFYFDESGSPDASAAPRRNCVSTQKLVQIGRDSSNFQVKGTINCYPLQHRQRRCAGSRPPRARF